MSDLLAMAVGLCLNTLVPWIYLGVKLASYHRPWQERNNWKRKRKRKGCVSWTFSLQNKLSFPFFSWADFALAWKRAPPPLKKKRNPSCKLRLWSKFCELNIFSPHQTIPSFSTLVRSPPLNIFNIFPSFNVHVFWFSPIWGKFCQTPKQFLKDFVTPGVGESRWAIWFPSVT